MKDPILDQISRVSLMAFVLWREARGEPRVGKIAIAYSILNRIAHPKWWGNDLYSVIEKPLQYSSMTYKKDPQLTLYWSDTPQWEESLDVARSVLISEVPPENPVPTADSYYATWMDTHPDGPPKWAATARLVAIIGHHKFYDTDGEHPANVKSEVAAA